ncbi:UDP-Glycosyltransferase/glycogen phosphorylase [Gautieria morchelliformis]|nr:UDP-Glycosyltransferase/glycogen phosphorylase [Gautieria morchelliformis]
MESSQATISGHILLLCMPEWGHLRPLCALAAKVVKERSDVAVTLLIVGEYGQRMEREIRRYFSASEADFRAKANIRLVNMYKRGGVDIAALLPMIVQEFPDYYAKLVNSEPVQCLETNHTLEALRKPTAVVLDGSPFLLPILQHIRSVTRRSIPVLAWSAPYASYTLAIAGPEKFGGFGDVEAKARTQAEATGRKLDDIMDELYYPSSGHLKNLAGLPPMYDYEWVCQEPDPGLQLNGIFSAAYRFACECDGFVSVSSAAYEPKSLEAMRTWLGETNRPVYAIGPLIPPGFGDTGLSDVAKRMEFASSNNGDESNTFLENQLKSHGERSIIYVSFGSYWWPRRNEHAWILVDVLLELGFPFIFSHASAKAVIPPGYAEKIKQSGIGLLLKWSPQQTILNHPATGWFLTHCGQNSVTEAMAQGIPMIAWPLEFDQPLNAAHLTLNLDVAFQMVEVRTGHGLKPLYRGVHPTGTNEAVAAEARNILQKARGPEGEQKRRNAESMRYKWKKEWKEGGEALSDLRRFLADSSSNSEEHLEIHKV